MNAKASFHGTETVEQRGLLNHVSFFVIRADRQASAKLVFALDLVLVILGSQSRN